MESLNIVFTGKDQVEVRREPVPALQSGQILVESQCTLISTGTEGIVLGRKFEAGTHWENWVKYPFAAGYNNAGRVIEVAPDVSRWKVGDRIASRSPHQQYRVLDAGTDDSSSRLSHIPAAISDEEAAWFGMACIAQVGVHTAKHELGDAVVIVGLGLLGQLVTQYVRTLGARKIIVIDTSEMRLEMAREHGATHVLKTGVQDARDRVLELTDGKGADVVYDITGFADVFAPALGLVRNFGKLVLLGDTGTPSSQRLTLDVITRGVRILGAHDEHAPKQETDANRWTKRNMTDLFFTFLERGQMRVEDLITHRYAPQDAPAAYQMLQTNRATAMGIIFDWTQVEQTAS
jgi:2-desacetyl-2-hydroxyethyl bacteriochlorophyllide A dehydrogenase